MFCYLLITENVKLIQFDKKCELVSNSFWFFKFQKLTVINKYFLIASHVLISKYRTCP